MEHQQHKSSRGTLHRIDYDYWVHTVQRVYKMAETKFAVLILNILGFPLLGYALFIANLDPYQAAVLWILTMSFLGARLYFYIVFAKQKKKKNDLELRDKEMEIMERENILISKINLK